MTGLRGQPDDRGSGSVLVLAVVVVLMGVAVGAGSLAQVVAARHRAAAAADLGALAAASQGWPHARMACAEAEWVVRANDAELVACRPDSSGVLVTAAVRPAGLATVLRLPPTIRSARAGPAPAPGGGPAQERGGT